MEKSNNDLIGELMNILKVSLRQYVEREFKSMYGGSKYLGEIETRLGLNNHTAPLEERNETLKSIDAQKWLKFLSKNFKNKLGTMLTYVEELNDSRNNWAHQQDMPFEIAYRYAGNATRLLTALKIPKAADETSKIEQEILQLQIKSAVRAEPALSIAQELPHPPVEPALITAAKQDVLRGEVPATSKFGIKPLWAGWQDEETVICFSPSGFNKWHNEIRPGTRMLLYETNTQRPGSSFKGVKGIVGEVEVVDGFVKSAGLPCPTEEHEHPLRVKVVHGRKSVAPISLDTVRIILNKSGKFSFWQIAWYPLSEAEYQEFLKLWDKR